MSAIAVRSMTGVRRHRTRRVPVSLVVGAGVLLALVAFGVIGTAVVDKAQLRVGSAPFGVPPSIAHTLGTDTAGRDVLALVVYGTPTTLEIGLLAGALGTALGVVLGLASGYYRGVIDPIVRVAADIALTIPALIVLVVLAAFVQASTIELLALIVGLLAWPAPTRAIRAQTLSLRERGFVALAKVSGQSDLEILFVEILPNLLPLIAVSFISAVSGGILASVGLQLLGLGSISTPSLGVMLQFAFEYGAIARGMWWWWAPPTVVLMLLFAALYSLTDALDRLANARSFGEVTR
jgi:peptide/nickel transport system permease protein